MKTFVCSQPGRLLYEEKNYPASTAGCSIVRVRQIGVCGTDLHAYNGIQPFFTYPRVLGHELAAEYVEGGAEGFSSGDLLTILPYKSCGTCFACKQGKRNCCSTLSVLGVHEDGGMSEFISVPDELLVHAKGLSLDQTALIEPLAIGAHAVTRAKINPHEFVLVIGAGPIGIGLLYFLSLIECKVIVAETNLFRLKFCRSTFPAVQCINPAVDDTPTALKDLTNGNMPSVVFDATGNLTSIHQSLSYLSHAGRYVLVGLQQGNIQVNHPEFHKREAMLMSSRNATHADFEFVKESMLGNKINPEEMITHRFEFDQLVEKFPTLYAEKDSLIKAMISC